MIGVYQNLKFRVAVIAIGALVNMSCAKDPVSPPAAAAPDFKVVNHGLSTSSLNAIWGISDINMFFVGASGTILKNEISGFTQNTSGTTNSLLAIFGADGANVYATGFLGTILHFNGATWAPLSPAVGTTLPINDVWVAGSTIFVVDPSSVRSIPVGGTAWTAFPTSSGLNAVFANSSDSFIVGASGLILKYRPGQSPTPMNSTTSANLNDIWGQGTFMVAVGANGTVLIGDGSSWTVSTQGQFPTLNAVWGFSTSDVYAVGNGGTVIRYNGTSWSPLTTPTTLDLQAVFGVNAKSVHVSGPGGLILHLAK